MQVLFAFLLTVPFTQRFTELTRTQEKIYFGTLICTAVATAFLIAPSAHHRIQFRTRDKRHLVSTANKFAIVGLSFLALAMTGAVLLVTDFIFSATAATITTGPWPCCSAGSGT